MEVLVRPRWGGSHTHIPGVVAVLWCCSLGGVQRDLRCLGKWVGFLGNWGGLNHMPAQLQTKQPSRMSRGNAVRRFRSQWQGTWQACEFCCWSGTEMGLLSSSPPSLLPLLPPSFPFSLPPQFTPHAVSQGTCVPLRIWLREMIFVIILNVEMPCIITLVAG